MKVVHFCKSVSRPCVSRRPLNVSRPAETQVLRSSEFCSLLKSWLKQRHELAVILEKKDQPKKAAPKSGLLKAVEDREHEMWKFKQGAGAQIYKVRVVSPTEKKIMQQAWDNAVEELEENNDLNI